MLLLSMLPLIVFAIIQHLQIMFCPTTVQHANQLYYILVFHVKQLAWWTKQNIVITVFIVLEIFSLTWIDIKLMLISMFVHLESLVLLFLYFEFPLRWKAPSYLSGKASIIRSLHGLNLQRWTQMTIMML